MKKFALFMICVLTVGAQFVNAQTKSISGIVTNKGDGTSIPGVSVMVKGTTLGTITNMDGQFELKVPDDAELLVFSFIGMKNLEIEIGDQTNFNVMMEPDVFSVDEVVVVGYGVQKKSEVTGSITSVKGDELANMATPSFDVLLAGKAAGVQVTQQTGILGEAPRMRIRGVGSISEGNYPLIIVDGIPVWTGDQGGYANGSNALGDINPADIESMEILKDGSATAIYGSRASNGVILITTKKGKSGKFRLNYNSYVGVASPIELFDLLHTQDFITINNEKRSNRGQSDIAVGTEYDTDWQGAVLRENAFQQDHNLSLSGANDVTNYYFSLGYTDQEGVTRPNSMTRYTFKANVEQKIKSWLTIGMNTGITRSEYYGLNAGTNSLSGNIFSAIRQLPNTPIYDENDPTGYNIDDVNTQLVGRWDNVETIGDNLPNIVYVINNNEYITKLWRTLGSAYGQVKFLKYMNFKTQINIDNSSSEGLLYYNPVHGDGASVNGRVQNNHRNAIRWNWQNILTFNKMFGDAHNLSVVLVNEFQKQRVNSFYGVGTNLSNDFFRHNLIDGAFSNKDTGGSMSENGFISYASRVNYSFGEKYFVQASLRYDGISSLPEKNKYGYFPGGSIGWNVVKEPFMQGISNVVSDLKIRGSYAVVGNVSIGNYPYAGLYGNYPYADYNGIAFSQAGNDELQWETSKKYDIGFDLILFEGKYQFTFDYFLNNQDDLILDAPTPNSLGIPGNSISRNIGSMKNWGYELSGEAFLINKNDFTWIIDANITFAKNEVKSLVDEQDITNTYTIIRVGESINSIYGYDYQGVNMANGNPVYRKGDGTLVQGNIETSSYAIYDPSNPEDVSQSASLSSSDDKIILGPSLPTFFGAVNNRFTWKNFDFGLSVRFSGGNYIMNGTRENLMNQNFTNNGTEILGRWQSKENPGDGWTPKLWFGGSSFIDRAGETNGRFVEKGNYMKLQNVTLGYNFPKSLVGRIGIDNLRLYIQGQELLMFTNYKGIDPEMESDGLDLNGTPRQRVMTVGVNLTL